MKVFNYRFKNIVLTLVMATLILAGVPNFAEEAYAVTTPPAIEGNGAVVIDAKSGEVLFDKNMNTQFEPASMTKMMTCILTLENRELTDIVTIDAETPFTGGSRIYLIEGEQITVQNLLYGLMLESANDCAVALAKEIGGSVPEFAAMMNAKAKELGCKHTNFVNPNGLHEEGHLSTAYDMALIAQYCMKNTTFRELVTTYKYDIPGTNKQPETRHLYNTNRLLYDNVTKVQVNGVTRGCKYEGCTGIKTGYTPQAGGCLTAGAQKEDTEIISVVMNSTDKGRFADTIALFDWAFANYHSERAVEASADMGTISVKGGALQEVGVVTKEDFYVLLPSEASSAIIKTEIKMDKSIAAPFPAGTKVGTLEVYAGDKLAGTVDLITTMEMKPGTILSHVGIENTQAYILFAVGGILLVAFIACSIYIAVLKRRRKRERQRRREERALAIARERAAREEDQQLRDWFF